MSSTNNLGKDHVISELNKQREVQMELIKRKNMLAEYIDLNTLEYDDVLDRLKDINVVIQDLRDTL